MESLPTSTAYYFDLIIRWNTWKDIILETCLQDFLSVTLPMVFPWGYWLTVLSRMHQDARHVLPQHQLSVSLSLSPLSLSVCLSLFLFVSGSGCHGMDVFWTVVIPGEDQGIGMVLVLQEQATSRNSLREMASPFTGWFESWVFDPGWGLKRHMPLFQAGSRLSNLLINLLSTWFPWPWS